MGKLGKPRQSKYGTYGDSAAETSAEVKHHIGSWFVYEGATVRPHRHARAAQAIRCRAAAGHARRGARCIVQFRHDARTLEARPSQWLFAELPQNPAGQLVTQVEVASFPKDPAGQLEAHEFTSDK